MGKISKEILQDINLKGIEVVLQLIASKLQSNLFYVLMITTDDEPYLGPAFLPICKRKELVGSLGSGRCGAAWLGPRKHFFSPGSHLGSQETAARRRTRCTACTSTSCHATSEAVLHILLSVSQCPIVDCIESISVARMDEVGLGADECFLCGVQLPTYCDSSAPTYGAIAWWSVPSFCILSSCVVISRETYTHLNDYQYQFQRLSITEKKRVQISIRRFFPV